MKMLFCLISFLYYKIRLIVVDFRMIDWSLWIARESSYSLLISNVLNSKLSQIMLILNCTIKSKDAAFYLFHKNKYVNLCPGNKLEKWTDLQAL